MSRTPKDLHRDVEDIAKRIVVIHKLIDPAVENLRDAQPGYPSGLGSGGGAPSLNDAGKPQGLERFVMRRDPAMADQRQLDELTVQARRLVTEMHRIVSVWSTPQRIGGEVVERLSGSECVVCNRYVSGSATDRLRAGLCNACRMRFARWKKINRGTRHDWMTAERGEAQRLAAIDEAS